MKSLIDSSGFKDQLFIIRLFYLMILTITLPDINMNVKADKIEVHMIISERIFEIMKEQKMSQRELSRRTGITISTISDWNTKKSNPASDKLLIISEALGISVEELLTGSALFKENASDSMDYKNVDDDELLEDYHNLSKSQQVRLIKYMKRLGEMNGEK